MYVYTYTLCASLCAHECVCMRAYPSGVINVQSNTDENIYIPDISWHPVDIEEKTVNML